MAELDEGTKAIIELAIDRAIERYNTQIEKRIDEKISTHTKDCAANKYKDWRQFVSGCIGGVIVAIANWLFK